MSRSSRRTAADSGDRNAGPSAAREAGHPLGRPAAWILVAFVAGAAFVAFLPALECGFNYDDDEVILRNENYRGLGWSNVRWAFTTFRMGHYQPLTWLTLGVDHAIWGMNPRGYHLTNLVLHAANSALVFLIAFLVLDCAGRSGAAAGEMSESPGVRGARAGALVAALLFALHPLRVESVAWVTERRDVLSSFWLLGAVAVYLHAQVWARAERRRTWLAVALGAYLLSLLSRAMGVTLPVVLLLVDWYPLRRLGGGSGRWFGRDVRAVWIEKIPFVVLAGVFAVLAPLAQASVGATIPWAVHGPVQRLAQAAYGLVFYIHKTVLPVCLSPLYELNVPIDPLAAKYVVSGAIVAATILALAPVGRRLPGVMAASAVYAILLSPVLGFVQSGRQEVADRYSYLPLISLAILVGGSIASLWRRPGETAAAAGLAAVCVLATAVSSLVTWRQCQVWKTPISLWTHGTACQPDSYLAHYNLGCAVALAGDQEKAIASFRRGLDLNPHHVKTRFNMANALQELGRADEALAEYARISEIDSADALSHYEMGRIFAMQGRADDAIAAFRKALDRKPDHVKSRVNLGAMLARKGDHAAALPFLEESVVQDPALGDAHYNLAISLYAVGQTERAIAEYRRTIDLMPGFADARVNLGNIFAAQGRLNEARNAYEDALKVAPGHPAASANLAALRRRMSAGG
ncbi:MAG: hypothetical protein DCC65_02875 [Planctomycetota bacterium]|nr:MAG: hypothetical protein DCC65_02875 [Planctomycetota bacterium]